jgi:hypothetical protein
MRLVAHAFAPPLFQLEELHYREWEEGIGYFFYLWIVDNRSL